MLADTVINMKHIYFLYLYENKETGMESVIEAVAHFKWVYFLLFHILFYFITLIFLRVFPLMEVRIKLLFSESDNHFQTCNSELDFSLTFPFYDLALCLAT